ncbi:hypothetical protein [Skermanella stibiiresistens]|nr:hypothetical protein [Skermanella stibiiresistens]
MARRVGHNPAHDSIIVIGALRDAEMLNDDRVDFEPAGGGGDHERPWHAGLSATPARSTPPDRPAPFEYAFRIRNASETSSLVSRG